MARSKTKKKISKRTVIIVFILIMIILAGIIFIPKLFNKEDKLVGLWDVDGNTKYEFNGKGNGKIIVPGSEFEFTYVIDDNVVAIDFKNETSRDTKYEFVLSKDNLELKDLEQTSVNLKLTKINNK